MNKKKTRHTNNRKLFCILCWVYNIQFVSELGIKMYKNNKEIERESNKKRHKTNTGEPNVGVERQEERE